MHTKDKLAAELNRVGLQEMAIKAEQGYYHDYLSPLAMPSYQLAADLVTAGTPAARQLLARHTAGEFDASREEAEAWAVSEDGKQTFRSFGRRRPQ